MKANLSRHISLWVGLPVLLLFGGMVWLASHRSVQGLVEETEKYTRGLARYHAARLEQRLARAAKIPENLGLMLEADTLGTEPELEAFLRKTVAGNPEVYGSCLAFEPEAFTPGKYFYAPYVYQKGSAVVFEQLGNPTYNYFQWEWYARARAEDRPIWTEPYFDEGGGNTLMTTYSVPFHRQGRVRGIATIDLALSQLITEVEQLPVGETGYTFMVSRKGRFIAYPNRTRIMRGSILETNADLGQHMIAGEQGFVRTTEPASGQPAWIAFQPVQQGDFSVAVVYPQAEVLKQAFRLQWELLAAGALGLLALMAANFIVARSISRPITQLARAAQQVAAGNLDLEVRTGARTEEVQELAHAFKKMTRELKMRMEELRYTTTVKERFEGELSAARTIQLSLVLKRFPAFPERPEVDVHAVLKPARAVGGDFYDFFFADADRLCLLAADVAGKGVPAALFMSVTHTLLRAHAALAIKPADMLAKANDELCREGSSLGMFCTLAFVLLDVRNGQVQIGNAGHPAPLRLTAMGEVTPLEAEGGIALGAWPGSRYEVRRHQLMPGDALLFYTDGVTEALSPEEQFFGLPRLEGLLRGMAGQPAGTITREIAREVSAFGGSREQADDLTLLAVRWSGPSFSAQAPDSLHAAS